MTKKINKYFFPLLSLIYFLLITKDLNCKVDNLSTLTITKEGQFLLMIFIALLLLSIYVVFHDKKELIIVSLLSFMPAIFPYRYNLKSLHLFASYISFMLLTYFFAKEIIYRYFFNIPAYYILLTGLALAAIIFSYSLMINMWVEISYLLTLIFLRCLFF